MAAELDTILGYVETLWAGSTPTASSPPLT